MGKDAILFPFTPSDEDDSNDALYVSRPARGSRACGAPSPASTRRDRRRPARVIDRARVILLDFDGPVCSIFAQHSASTVAHELRRLLVDQAVTLPHEILAERRPARCAGGPARRRGRNPSPCR
ncbi:hypothetical protein [Salinispora arenicola]|uniref:hypothetical protein n=1 Tax=Salinispora arenicola TaxID=168697 RepID=UPI0027DB40B9|nr:hypothetical protein [Salinispora arenicola]